MMNSYSEHRKTSNDYVVYNQKRNYPYTSEQDLNKKNINFQESVNTQKSIVPENKVVSEIPFESKQDIGDNSKSEKDTFLTEGVPVYNTQPGYDERSFNTGRRNQRQSTGGRNFRDGYVSNRNGTFNNHYRKRPPQESYFPQSNCYSVPQNPDCQTANSVPIYFVPLNFIPGTVPQNFIPIQAVNPYNQVQSSVQGLPSEEIKNYCDINYQSAQNFNGAQQKYTNDMTAYHNNSVITGAATQNPANSMTYDAFQQNITTFPSGPVYYGPQPTCEYAWGTSGYPCQNGYVYHS